MRRIIAVAAVLFVSLVGASPAAAETEEGIQVHGHWKIEIFESNGKIVSATEFDNALVIPVGQQFVALVLGSFASVGSYGIVLENGSGSGPCDDGSGGDRRCFLIESGSNWHVVMGTADSTNLVIDATTAITVSGSVTADFADSVADVALWYKMCTPGTSPDACLGASAVHPPGQFTLTTLPSPVPVDAGQIIQVTVTISFS